jgi:DNA processing protein
MEIQPGLFETGPNLPPAFNSQQNMETYVSIMALSSIKGVGQKTIEGIYEKGAINSIWSATHNEIENLVAAIHKKKLNLAQIISKEKSKLLNEGKQKVESLVSDGINFIADKYQYFPKALSRLTKPPKWLFIMGNAEALFANGIVAVIGTRSASQEGKFIAYHLSKELVFNNIVVLSGLAEGIDRQAHKGAIDHYGRTIGVLGHGFEAVYATKDKQLWSDITVRDGAVITEYLPDESPSRENFLRRNEIQAALSNLVIPVEVPDLASGTGATIRRAISLQKPLCGIGLDEKSTTGIKQTADNLRSLKIPTFNFPSEKEKFWNFAKWTMPQHTLSSNSRTRQKRFLRVLFETSLTMYNFEEELKRASFTESDIDWLASEIKKRLGRK